MAHEILNPDSVHPTAGYSHAAKAGTTVYIAGQIAKDRQGNVVGAGDIRAQARQVYTNLKAVAEAAGGGLQHVVKMTTYLTDPRFIDPWREVRAEFFGEPMPPNTLLVIDGLVTPEFLIEVEAVAVLD